MYAPHEQRVVDELAERRRNLVKAGALILAEIERLVHLQPTEAGGGK